MSKNLKKLEDFCWILVKAKELSAEQEANNDWEKEGENFKPVTGSWWVGCVWI